MKKHSFSILTGLMLLPATTLTVQAQDIVIQPYISGLSSPTTDRLVTFDASRSACYEKTIMAWSEMGHGTVFDGVTYACDMDGDADGICVIDGISVSEDTACTSWSDCLPTCSLDLLDENGLAGQDGVYDTCSLNGLPCDSNADCHNPIQTSQILNDLPCSYSWNVGGPGTVTDGSVTSSYVQFQYDDAGDYDVTLTITSPDLQNASETISVSANTVQPPAKSATFSSAITDATCDSGTCVGGGNNGQSCQDISDCPGGSVDLRFTTIPAAGVPRVYIYWGDRTRTVLSGPTLTTVASHTYAREGTYNIRVKTYDNGHNKLNYTTTDSAALSVTP